MRNLSDLFEKSLDAPRLNWIRRVADESAALGFPVYIVGGFVRDLLLRRKVKDFDIVVEGDAITLGKALAKEFGGKLTIHPKFGTASWSLPEELTSGTGINDTLDLISARSEIYTHPGALPTVKRSMITEDLRRRDFTVNAMAIRLDGNRFGELLDPFGGRTDLGRGSIRVLHPRSFVDDPTRMLRAVRYEGRHGFRIDSETLALVPEARPLVNNVSAQRIRHELDLILEEPNATSILARLAELDLLQPVHPALRWDQTAKAHVEQAVSSAHTIHNFSIRNLRWLLWLMPLSKNEIESINKRLLFTANLLKSLLASAKIYANLTSLAGLKPSECVEQLDEFPLPAVYAVSLGGPNSRSRRMLEKYISEWRHVKPHVGGHDLKNLGLLPGPQYQKILRRLRAAWLDGEITSASQESAFLRNLFSVDHENTKQG